MKRAIIYATCLTALLTLAWGRASASQSLCLRLEYGGPSWPTTMKLILTEIEDDFLSFIGEHICTDPEGHVPSSSPLQGVAHARPGGQFHVGVNVMGGIDSNNGGTSCPGEACGSSGDGPFRGLLRFILPPRGTAPTVA